jgi:hypothetical protein
MTGIKASYIFQYTDIIAYFRKLYYFCHPELWKDLRLLATTEKNAKLTAAFDKIVCLLKSAQIFRVLLKMDFTINIL